MARPGHPENASGGASLSIYRCCAVRSKGLERRWYGFGWLVGCQVFAMGPVTWMALLSLLLHALLSPPPPVDGGGALVVPLEGDLHTYL